MPAAPVFRKAILPWYDTTAACILLFVCMAAVAAFGVVGLLIALETQAFHRCIWMPALVVGLSGLVCASVLIRLIRRLGGRL